MAEQQASATDLPVRHHDRRGLQRWWLGATAALVLLGIIGVMLGARTAGATAHDTHDRVAGAGKTIIEGGTGGAGPVPVTTLVAFHANAEGGAFECLALSPPGPTGAGSGEFTINAMYVTGKVSSLTVENDTATLHGTATVTGLGAGKDVPFTAQVTAGGPGTTITLMVAGLTFHETLVEGTIRVS
jgi:hypothetical protein